MATPVGLCPQTTNHPKWTNSRRSEPAISLEESSLRRYSAGDFPDLETGPNIPLRMAGGGLGPTPKPPLLSC